jgi:PucR C-terminal helix-turn-helix domain/GGDEF-like domain
VHKEEVLQRLERDAAGIGRRMALAVREEIAEYAAVRDPAFAAEVLAHSVEHVHAFVRSARERRPPEGDELEFVRTRGAARARELLPLDALLEAYLVGQRTVWEAVVAAAGPSREGMRVAQELTAATFTYTHAINVAIAAAYMQESQALASEAERGRRDLLDVLLSGREPGSDQERRAETLGLRPRGDHLVVVAAADPPSSRLIAQALARQDPDSPFVVARHDELVALVRVYVRRGPQEVRGALERAAEWLRRAHDIELRAGVSTVCAGLPEVARGYAEAASALKHARPDRPAVALEDVTLLDHLTAGADSAAARLVPAGARRLADADGALAATLRAYAACDLNVARTAQRLTVHPNTVHYRLRRVHELTGRDPRRFGALAELLTALDLLAADHVSPASR